jgi:uncharacterized protein YndB with AHSA1/START domain/ketosteroid isomerase-like protein
MIMTTNKTTIELYMDGFRRADRPQILACLTDDVEWVIPGMFHARGKDAFAAHIVDDGFVGQPVIAVSRLLEAGDVVVAEGSVRAPRDDGTFLNLAFCDVFDMRDGKIRRLTSYLAQLSKGGPPMPASTIRLHRVLRAKPETVYRAFLDADALAKWLPPNGFTAKVHQMDARVGGTFQMSFTNFATGESHSFGGEYLELTPPERIRYTDTFEDPSLPGEIQVTVTLKKVSVGTELTVVQEGVPDVIPVEACYLGWQDSLALLAKLVEAGIVAQ